MSIKNNNAQNFNAPPTNWLDTAIITWLGITNDEVLEPKNVYNLMELWHETLFVWTYKPNTYSNIIVVADQKVKKQNIWKTSASILELAFSLCTDLEHQHKFWYNRIYNFDYKLNIDAQKYRDNQSLIDNTRTIKSLTDLYHVIRIIDLLIRDDKYFISSQNLYAAKLSHNFCQQCALVPDHVKLHLDEEPEIREYIQLLPAMEMAVVNSTRSIEALIWQPWKRENAKKLEKIKQRRKDVTGINPDNIFKIAWVSYIDFYYDLFEIRRFSAHSFWKINFDLQRVKTIKAQSLAFEVNLAYFNKNKSTVRDAIKNIKFNLNLYKKFPKDFSTNRTKKV